MPRVKVNRDADILALLPATRFQIAEALKLHIKIIFRHLNMLKERDAIHSKQTVGSGKARYKLWELGPMPELEPVPVPERSPITIPHEPLTALYGRYDAHITALMEGA